MVARAVFLDRDGVINDNSKKVNQPGELVIFPWAGAAIRQLKKAGYLVFIVTNQGGIELGYFTEADLAAIHSYLESQLREQDAAIDEIVHCPHFHQDCECRKPKPGMILALAAKYNINLMKSWMIGDRESDIKAGKAAGCRTVKLGETFPGADLNCNNLEEAAILISNHQTSGLPD